MTLDVAQMKKIQKLNRTIQAREVGTLLTGLGPCIHTPFSYLYTYAHLLVSTMLPPIADSPVSLSLFSPTIARLYIVE